MDIYLRKNRVAMLCFMAPTVILFTVLVCYPILQTFYRSFFNWDGLSIPKYYGIRNYMKLFASENFYTALKNGLYFALVLVVYQITVGTILALTLLDGNLKFRRAFKTAYFIPVVLSITVVCQLWLSIYHIDYGLLNSIFGALGVTYRQEWLAGKNSAIFAVAFTNAWQYMGVQMVFIYTGAKSIPEHYAEAAYIDGASKLRTSLYITLPLLRDTYKFCLILAVTGGLQAFSNMYIMTGGGPGTYTYTLTYLMYQAAFYLNQRGLACAVATILVLQCLLFTILIQRFVARESIAY